jgi:hypothetical protein
VHNAKVLLGRESTLSETITDFHLLGARIGLGYFGSNPYTIGDVLAYEGIQYSCVEVANMANPGVYVISYWNSHSVLDGLHTIAVSYDGTAYTAYNLYGNGKEYSINPVDYSDRFICGYYLGG